MTFVAESCLPPACHPPLSSDVQYHQLSYAIDRSIVGTGMRIRKLNILGAALRRNSIGSAE